MNESTLAKVLRGLLDETKFFTRQEWARFFGVEETKLVEWVTDVSLPRPDLLRMLLDLLHNSANVPAQPLAEFDALLTRPAREISPLAERLGSTLAEYLERNAVQAMVDELKAKA